MTIYLWSATCAVCGGAIHGRDIVGPGGNRDRGHEHDNPADMYRDIPGTGGAHSSWPDEATIQITRTYQRPCSSGGC